MKDKQSEIDRLAEDYTLSLSVQKALMKLTVGELRRLCWELSDASNRIFIEGQTYERDNPKLGPSAYPS